MILALATPLALTGCAASSPPTAAPSVAVATAAASAGAGTPAPRDVFRGVVIGIDPGHNRLNGTHPSTQRLISNGRGHETETCNTTGTETDSGYLESTFTWRVGRYLAADLRARGAKPVLTRHSNRGVGPCVNQRARIINRARAAVAIDIHADGGPASGRGFAILEPVRSGINNAVVPASRRYARLLRTAFRRTGMPVSTYDGVDGLQPRPDLGGLNLTTVPQALIECGNMRNARDAAMLTSPAFQKRAARAIMTAMGRFLATRPPAQHSSAHSSSAQNSRAQSSR